MKKILIYSLLIVCIISFGTLTAQTIVPEGDIYGTWTADGSPYQIEGHVIVPTDSILIIEAGVTVEFQGHYMFLVFGEIFALGSETDTIVFTIKPELQEEGWNRIDIIDEVPTLVDSSIFQFCKFEYGYANNFFEKNNGGALSVYESKINISNCLFENNRSIYIGGAVFAQYSDIIIENCEFKNNSAEQSGSGAIALDVCNSKVNNCSFTENSALNDANSLGIYGGNAIIDGCTFYNNTGGYCTITLSDADELDRYVWFTNNLVYSNTGNYCGGIYIAGNDDYYSAPYIYNNIIVNNHTSGSNAKSGGIWIYYSNPLFSNNTVCYNSSDQNGGGIWLTDATSPTFHNSIIYGNQVNGDPNQVYLEFDDSDPNFINCDFQGGTDGIILETGVTYNGQFINNIDSDPIFIDTASINYLLACNSPCINKGTADTSGLLLPLVDLRNLPRIVDDTVDIGAYEFQSLMIIEQPSDTGVCINGTVILEIIATGDFITYQWQKDDIDIPGATAPTLSLNNVTLEDEGNYRCTIANGCSTIQSEEALLTIYPYPDVYLGNDTTITVKDTLILNAGENYLSYVWQDGQTNQYYSIFGPHLDPGVYNYSVTIIDSLGCSNSDTIQITVIDDSGIKGLNYSNLVTIYPNPNDGVFNVHFAPSVKGKFTIEISSLKGDVLFNKEFKNKIAPIKINLSEFEKGIYLLFIKSEEINAIKKIIIF